MCNKMTASLKEQILYSLKNTNCRIKSSPIEGVGVFAIKDIPEDTKLFTGSPEKSFETISIDELEGCEPEVVEMVKGFFASEKNGKYWIPDGGLNAIDISFFLNHSENPNVTTTADGDTFYAARYIAKGEELTTSYTLFDAGFDPHRI